MSLRVFVAGASGVIGLRLVPMLVEAGHTVTGMTRTPEKVSLLERLGAVPAICDVYDVKGTSAAVRAARPDVVIDQLTDLPDSRDEIPGQASANNRIRREGTANLIDAARSAGATGFIVQSIAWNPPGDGAAAKRDMEQMVLDFGGVVLRYGQFYGPGTYFERDRPEPPRIQIDEAARRTIDALGLSRTTVIIEESTPGL